MSKAYACADDSVDSESKPCDNNISKLDNRKDNVNIELSDGYATANETGSSEERIKTPMRLIRSNSFVVEKPSPLLLAQIEGLNIRITPSKRKQWGTCVDLGTFSDKTSNENKNIETEKIVCLKDKKVKNKRRYSPNPVKRNNNLLDKSSRPNSMKRKGWDLKNAKQKWSSIENDLCTLNVNNNNKIEKKFNSLPPSTSSSPNKNMFDTKEKNVTEKESKNNCNKVIISTLVTPTNDILAVNSIKTEPLKITGSGIILTDNTSMKTYPKKILRTPKKLYSDRFLKGFVTPVKSLRDNFFDVPSKDTPIRRTQSARKPKKEIKLRQPNTIYLKESPYYVVSEKDKHLEIVRDVTNNILLPEKDYEDIRNTEPNIDYSTRNDLINEAKTFDFKKLFLSMQETHKKQLTELMKQQKDEQELFLKKFSEQQSILLSKISQNLSYTESQHESPTNDNNNDLIKSSENIVNKCRSFLGNQHNKMNCDTYQSTNYNSNNISPLSTNDTLRDVPTIQSDSADTTMEEVTVKYVSPYYNDFHVISSAEFTRSVSDDSLETAAHVMNSYFNGGTMVAQIENNITVSVDSRNREQIKSNCSRALFTNPEKVYLQIVFFIDYKQIW